MKKRLFRENDIVKINGDIEFDDYNVRVDTQGVILMNEVQGETQLLVNLDEIDGVRKVSVYVDIDLMNLINSK